MKNLSDDELAKELYNDFYLDPKLHRFLKIVCWFLWVLAAQECIRIYLKSSPSHYEIALAVAYVIGAAGVNSLYLWATKSGYMEKIRKEGK